METMTNTIVVVDDDVLNLKMARRILSDIGMRVVAFTSGKEFLTYVRKNALPDLVLMDIAMPGMDGFEALKLFRIVEKERSLPETPVIFITAHDDSAMESKGFEAGISDYIRKPFDPDVFALRVENALKKHAEFLRMSEEVITDNLTGLLNKNAISREAELRCSGDEGCLMIVDLDAFKLVNDLYGHTAGDDILKGFAGLLRKYTRMGSTIGRIGGDEFLIFSPLSEEEPLKELIDHLNQDVVALAQSVLGKEMDIPIGVSMGAVFVPEATADFSMAFRLADKALYAVKQNGKHDYCIWSDQIGVDDSVGEMSLAHFSTILEERNMRNLALSLNKETFIPIYRFVMRYIRRYGKSASNVLFTLTPKEDAPREELSEYYEKFGECAQGILRKSDVVTRPRANQFLVMLTDIRKGYTSFVIEKILSAWEKTHIGAFDITYEDEFLDYTEDTTEQHRDTWVMVADDDTMTIQMIGTCLSENEIRVTAFTSGQDLLDNIGGDLPDLILLDVNMPGIDGFETLRRLRAKNDRIGEIPVVFLTADDDEESEKKALKLGAMDFIRKPIVPEVLSLRVAHSIELIRLHRDLADEVSQKTVENEQLFFHVVQSLAAAIDAKDTYTNGHSERVAIYTEEIARRSGYEGKRLNDIYIMALLHDVGKIGVPRAIINKPGKLTDEEFDVIKTHPVIGAQILSNIREMPELSTGARWHHERYGGGGYPDGIRGEDIPEQARIIAVADAYDAMTSKRSYRDALPQDVVRSEIEKGRGSQFDPRFADIMLEMIDADTGYDMREK